MKRELEIDGTTINDDTDAWVIAEIGHNHGGDVARCKDLFRAAKECGASAVKLQKRDNKTLFTKAMYDSPYANENSYGATYGAHREALEFGNEQYLELQAFAKELKITFFSTAFDFKSADFLADLNVPAFKIASSDCINTPLLKHVAKFQKPMIVSTGGCNFEDVMRMYDTVMPINPRLAVLQCTCAYPAEPEQMNLRVITSYRERMPQVTVGLSDHQNGIALSSVAYVLGARVVEKHFTLNRAWKGTDHAFSLEREGLRKMVRDLGRVRHAMGDGIKRRAPYEDKPLFKMGKKLVAAKDLPAGHLLTRDDVALKTPNDGLPPFELERVIGKVLKSPLKTDDNITFDGLKG